MPTPDDQRQRGAQIQTSQSRVGPSVQKTATSSPFAGGGAGGQTPTQLQIGQQGQIKDAGTGLFDAISGTARGVQQGINNYEQYFEMVSKIDYSEFQTAYAQQRDLVNGDPKKMAAWLENNSYVPNRVTANAYWNLHADVNQKSYEQDQDDQLLQFEKRISSLQTPEQLNEISQQMKKLDPDSRFYKALELQEIKLGQRQAAVNRKAMVNGIRADNAIKNESLVASIKAAHGEKYNMFLSSEAFQQVLIAQSFGLAGVDATNGTITIGDNISYRMDSFPTQEVMPGLLDEISKKTEAEGLDIFEAHYSAANLPRGLMGNSARYTPSEAEKAVATKRMNDAISGSNPRDVLVMAGQAYPSDPQKGLVGFFDGMITQSSKKNLDNMTPEELTRLTQTLDGAINLLDPENTEAFSVIAGPNDSAESVRNLYAGRMKQLVAARQSVTNSFVTRGVTGILEKSSEAISSDELAASSTLSLAGMRPHIASLTGDVDLHFVTPDGNHMMIPSTQLGKTPTDGLIFAGMQYRDQEVLEDSLGISSKLPASVIMAQEMVKRTNQITGLVEGRVDVTPDLTRDLVSRLTKRSEKGDATAPETLRAAIVQNRDRMVSLLDSSEETRDSLLAFADTLPENDLRTDFLQQSDSRTILHNLYKVGSSSDRAAIMSTFNPTGNQGYAIAFELGVGAEMEGEYNSERAATMVSALQSNPRFTQFSTDLDLAMENIYNPPESSDPSSVSAKIVATLQQQFNAAYGDGSPELFTAFARSRIEQLKVANRVAAVNDKSPLYLGNPSATQDTLGRFNELTLEGSSAFVPISGPPSNPGSLPGPSGEMTSPIFQVLAKIGRTMDSQSQMLSLALVAPESMEKVADLRLDSQQGDELFSIISSPLSDMDSRKKKRESIRDFLVPLVGNRKEANDLAKEIINEVDNSTAIGFVPDLKASDTRMIDHEGQPVGQVSSSFYAVRFNTSDLLSEEQQKFVANQLINMQIERNSFTSPDMKAYTPFTYSFLPGEEPGSPNYEAIRDTTNDTIKPVVDAVNQFSADVNQAVKPARKTSKSVADWINDWWDTVNPFRNAEGM